MTRRTTKGPTFGQVKSTSKQIKLWLNLYEGEKNGEIRRDTVEFGK